MGKSFICETKREVSNRARRNTFEFVPDESWFAREFASGGGLITSFTVLIARSAVSIFPIAESTLWTLVARNTPVVVSHKLRWADRNTIFLVDEFRLFTDWVTSSGSSITPGFFGSWATSTWHTFVF